MSVNNRSILRNRTLKLIPVLTDASRRCFVDQLAADIEIEGRVVSTAPLKTSEVVDLLGVSYYGELASQGVIDQTDWLSHWATLECLVVRLGKQFFFWKLDLAYAQGGSSRQLALRSDLLANLHAGTRSVGGEVLAMIDPYTAAGIHINIECGLYASIHREQGHSSVDSTIRSIEVSFPAAKDVPSLADEELRAGLSKEIIDLVGKNFEVVGYLLDAERVNRFKVEPHVPAPSAEELRASAAISLAGRHRQVPDHHPV